MNSRVASDTIQQEIDELQKLSPQAMREHCVAIYERELGEKIKSQDDVRGYALVCAIRKSGKAAIDQSVQHAASLIARTARKDVDYAYWAKAAYWTIDETCALLSEIPPSSDLRCEDILPLANYAEPAKRFSDLRRLLLRANHDAPYARLQPQSVLAWARNLNIEVPQPLADEIGRVGTPAHQPEDTSEDLKTRERRTLLCIIGALAAHANIDLSQPLKAGDTIAAMMPNVKLSGRTIGEHLKAVREAMDSRKG